MGRCQAVNARLAHHLRPPAVAKNRRETNRERQYVRLHIMMLATICSRHMSGMVSRCPHMNGKRSTSKHRALQKMSAHAIDCCDDLDIPLKRLEDAIGLCSRVLDVLMLLDTESVSCKQADTQRISRRRNGEQRAFTNFSTTSVTHDTAPRKMAK